MTARYGHWNTCACGRQFVYPDLFCDVHKVRYMLNPAPPWCARCTCKREREITLRSEKGLAPESIEPIGMCGEDD